jgi:hypothetical protein
MHYLYNLYMTTINIAAFSIGYICTQYQLHWFFQIHSTNLGTKKIPLCVPVFMWKVILLSQNFNPVLLHLCVGSKVFWQVYPCWKQNKTTKSIDSTLLKMYVKTKENVYYINVWICSLYMNLRQIMLFTEIISIF